MAKRLAVIGVGSMGSAVVRGLLKVKWTTASHLVGAHPRKERASELAKGLGIDVVTSAVKAVEDADVVLLGVKPQILPEVLELLRGKLKPRQLVISLAAGIKTAAIEAVLPGIPVVRSMPNLAATVGMGATAICAGTHATKEHLALAREVFSAVGTVEEVPEKLMDAVTGLSGTGPMYVFHFVEAMADAGVKVGLSRDVASRLALQTLIGSAHLARDSHLHSAALKDQVTSPGGTAIAALHVLRREGFQAIVMDAVEAATKRAQELGQ
ncbi:MAG: pyrroline-5-carboxylate reductase [Candidatus Thermoplasmatota archaeon]